MKTKKNLVYSIILDKKLFKKRKKKHNMITRWYTRIGRSARWRERSNHGKGVRRFRFIAGDLFRPPGQIRPPPSTVSISSRPHKLSTIWIAVSFPPRVLGPKFQFYFDRPWRSVAGFPTRQLRSGSVRFRGGRGNRGACPGRIGGVFGKGGGGHVGMDLRRYRTDGAVTSRLGGGEETARR